MKQPKAYERLRVWRVLRRELVLNCQPWLALWREKIRLPDGREIDDYYQIEQRDYVLIAAWQNGKVFGLCRYKHGPRRINLGLLRDTGSRARIRSKQLSANYGRKRG